MRILKIFSPCLRLLGTVDMTVSMANVWEKYDFNQLINIAWDFGKIAGE